MDAKVKLVLIVSTVLSVCAMATSVYSLTVCRSQSSEDVICRKAQEGAYRAILQECHRELKPMFDDFGAELAEPESITDLMRALFSLINSVSGGGQDVPASHAK